MNPIQERGHLLTRRHFFGRMATGVGAAALGSLLNPGLFAALAGEAGKSKGPLGAPHFAPKAKRVIYLFMAGGPSQMELFDYKPALQKLHNQPIPDSFIAGKRFAFMSSFTREKPKCLGTRRKFTRHGQHGTYVSDCFPHIASIA